MKPLRLVIVTQRFWPKAGAAERLLVRLAVELSRRGCQVGIVTALWNPHWPAQIRFGDIPVVRLGPPPEGACNTWQYVRTLGRWLRRHAGEFDVAYVSGLRQEAYAAVRALRGLRPLVLAVDRAGRQGDCVWQIESGHGERIKRHCLRADALVAPTPAVRRELEAAGYPGDRIHDLPWGARLPAPREPASRAAARTMLSEANALLKLDPRAPLAVWTGRLAEGCGWDHLLAAWPAVVRRWPGARLWLVGESPDRPAVLDRIQSLELVGRAALVGAFDEIDGLLAAADLFIAPAPEGAPDAVLEAMAAQLPIVAVDAPANRWLMTDGREGLLAPPGDPAALSDAVLRLLGDPELAARLASAARQRVAADFSLARMVDDHLTLLHRLVP